jgi:glutamate-1-semialdehyde 2,1-aminomutase
MSTPAPALDDVTTNSPIEAAYRARTPSSARNAERAQGIFPSGIVHDARRMWPYALYMERASGSRKWDVDGNEYVDYYGGHGALILGHGHPRVVEAARAQLALGTHFAACHELEMQWGEQVQSMVPCAERVRFTSSGTEANLMALRLARAATGRDRIVRFRGHFHGWHDHVACGVDSHFDGTPTPGVLSGIAEQVLLADSQDVAGTTALLESRDDIAAVILEPTGGSFGALPLPPSMLQALRDVTAKRGIVLIFDEVVTGFRVSPGGAQSYYGVTPDMATFAKIVSGGLPGGCITGKKSILDFLDFDVSRALGREKVGHQGTYNANPLCAASGLTALQILDEEGICEMATKRASALRKGVNEVFAQESVPWACYGTHSAFYFFTGGAGAGVDPADFNPFDWSIADIKACASQRAVHKLRLALLVHGVDISSKPGGLVSGVHSDADIDETIEAVRLAVRDLKAEGEL